MNKKKDKEFVDKMLAKCFVVNNIAFNVVQTGAFGEFVKAMAEYGAHTSFHLIQLFELS